MLSREQILAARQLTRETVTIPEWSGEVIVSVMSGTERDAWESEIALGDKADFFTNKRAKLVARCVVNEAGEKLFSDSDVANLGLLDSVALDRIASVAQRMNKLTDKDMEEVKGNS